MAYGYVSLLQLKTALLQRLQDTFAVFTLDAEAGLYITEALQTLNALAPVWNVDQQITFNPGDTWKTVNFAGSARQRTTTDTDIYTLIEYHLLEPPTGALWTGTTQFNIADISTALQYRLNELLQATSANVVNFALASPTGDVRTALPDTLLQLRRVRWIPSSGSPYALAREDVTTANAYANNRILTPGNPESYYVTSTPPLYFDCTSIPSVPGAWDILALETGATLAPPATTILGLPNDWCWVAKWGVMADVLANSPESTDQLRAKYCLERYANGMKAMISLPWLLNASVSRIPTDTVSVQETDAYQQNWENVQPLGDPQIVIGGMDLVSLAPNVLPTGTATSALLNVVSNAPVPANDAAQIQLSRDGVDAVLNYAQHLASFKQGGKEFAETMPLYQQFEKYCAAVNDRYAALGILRPEMLQEGDRGETFDPRIQEQDEGVLAIQKQARAWRNANA